MNSLKQNLQITIIFFLFSFFYAKGQDYINGRIIDAETNSPLAFVNVVYNEQNMGTVSNIDGYFKVPANRAGFLKISYIGYQQVVINSEMFNQQELMTIPMKKTRYAIKEIRVIPEENPAIPIIKKVIKNKDRNNPEKINAFSYISYNKTYFNYIPDSISFSNHISNQSGKKDSYQLPDPKNILNHRHLFLLESISHRKFMYPGKNKEKILASRVSGFEDPSFTLLATRLQSFSFYNDDLFALNRNFINPIGKGSIKKYKYILEDKHINENYDTIYTIIFQPGNLNQKDKLSGIMFINTNGYAIQNVIAYSKGGNALLDFRIQQLYEQVDGKYWFPKQLNTDMIFNKSQRNFDHETFKLIGKSKSYIMNVDLSPDITEEDFDNVVVEVDSGAHEKPVGYWAHFRKNRLTDKDILTYHEIDSIGKVIDLDGTLKRIETMYTGYIPFGIFNVSMKDIIGFNKYEGIRLGWGMMTNQKLSDQYSIGGHIAYGFRDGKIKYGLEGAFHPLKRWKITAWHVNDLEETGGYSFIDDEKITSTSFYRRFFIEDMHENIENGLSFEQKFKKNFTINLSLKRSVKGTRAVYTFNKYLPEENKQDDFIFSEIGLQFKYTINEKYMETPRGNLITLGSDDPEVYGNFFWGTSVLGGEYEYLRAELKISDEIIISRWGQIDWQLEGGMINRNVPVTELYTGKASFGHFNLESANSFSTMRLNEFYGSRFISLFSQFTIQDLFSGYNIFKPDLIFANNIGVSEMEFDRAKHLVSIQSYNKGYFETGVLLANLISQSFLGYGFGIFYRYGPYRFSKTSDNFAYKFTLHINLK